MLRTGHTYVVTSKKEVQVVTIKLVDPKDRRLLKKLSKTFKVTEVK